ncbi:MAG TPA: cell division protein ZapA [Verrucomicrobiae bacterium]|nr:cell division protein ZapA [Verrucomicrobiae bacterium]
MKVEIFNQTYNVAAGDDEDRVRKLAEYVDARMREVSEATRTVDSVKVAVLAALNIADEMFVLQQKQDEIQGPLRKRVEKCVQMVERALEQSN